jgi:hypothetical protein
MGDALKGGQKNVAHPTPNLAGISYALNFAVHGKHIPTLWNLCKLTSPVLGYV